MSDLIYDNKIKDKLLTRRNIVNRGYKNALGIISPCWEYTRYTTNTKYGQIYYKDKLWLVHRLILLLYRPNEFNPELLSLHHCDNPPCFNPDHLFQGTDRDNRIDAINKGKWKNSNSRKTHCKRGHEFTPENTRLDYRGNRQCIICYKNKMTYDNIARLSR